MRPISRRAVLTMGGLGLASTAVGGTGLWRELNPSRLDPATGESFTEPEVLRSQGGRLQVRLEASLGVHDVAGRETRTMGYNGGVPGPTLRLRPGDTLRVDLVNRLEEVTNLHVHGLHVSPEGNGDNIFHAVEPGQTQRYEHRSIEKLHAGAGPGGVEGAGPGLGSATSHALPVVVVLLLLALGGGAPPQAAGAERSRSAVTGGPANSQSRPGGG